MAQNKYLQLLRNSSFAANYEAAVAAIKDNAPKMDGAPIVVRFTEGEGENAQTRALLGVSYGEAGNVHFVELGGERISDVKKALEDAIASAKQEALQAAADAKQAGEAAAAGVQGNLDEHVSEFNSFKESNTEIINGVDAKVDGVIEIIGEGFTSGSTVADAIEALEGKVGAIKVVSAETATAVTYTVEGAAEGSAQIVVDKDDSLKSVELGTIEDGEFKESAEGEIIRFIYNLADGTEKTVDINMSHVITEAELNALANDMAGDGLVASEGVLSVGQGTYTTVTEDVVDVNLTAVDAALVGEGMEVAKAIAAVQKASEDADAAQDEKIDANTEAIEGLNNSAVKKDEFSTTMGVEAGSLIFPTEAYVLNGASTVSEAIDALDLALGGLRDSVAGIEVKSNEVEQGSLVKVAAKVDATDSVYTVEIKSVDETGLNSALENAEKAAKEYASGYTETAIETAISGLTAEEVKEEGKVIVAVSQANGVVSAELGTVAAKYVTVEDTADVFSGETVEAVLAELDSKINTIAGEAIGVEGSETIDIAVEGTMSTISVKISEAEGNIVEVNDGVYVSNVWDCGTF